MGTDFVRGARLGGRRGGLVAGEETALLAALEGDRGMPVIRPPYPTERGLGGAPTVVQNGETLAHAAWIATNGAKKFRAIGSREAPGTKLVSVYGRVAQPGWQVALGTAGDRGAGRCTGTTKAVFVGARAAARCVPTSLTPTTTSTCPRSAPASAWPVPRGRLDTCMVDSARFFPTTRSEVCRRCCTSAQRLVETPTATRRQPAPERLRSSVSWPAR
jgi:NADH-quinone oxidoreductase subunit F